MLDRQGIAVPRPTPEERRSFGRFAADYDIILAFHDQMNQTVIPRVGDVIRRGSFNGHRISSTGGPTSRRRRIRCGAWAGA